MCNENENPGTYLENDKVRCKRCHCDVNSKRAADQGDPHARYCPMSLNYDNGDRYKIVRMYFNRDIPRRTIARNLTLKEAQAHCKDPETSSSTASSATAKRRTKRLGPWFDGYEKD